MKRNRSTKKIIRSTRRRTRSQSKLSKATGDSKTTQALRIEAQIAMLKRALLAAEDEGLPHKVICEYLHTLSQMAKLESFAAPDESDTEEDQEPKDRSPPRLKNIEERLRQAVAEIYGISDSPNGVSIVPPKAERTGNK